MRLIVSLLLAGSAVLAGETKYELAGRIVPGDAAAVSLFGAVTPFSAATLADEQGRFRFRDLLAGTYTLSVFLPSRGETRRTIEVGPSLADAKGKVSITVEISEAGLENRDAPSRRAIVSARELSIPDRARKEYAEAQRQLSRHQVDRAIAHLERAVGIAPQFSAAWNNLGTIAYQSRRYPDAEGYFRKAMEQDSTAFEPLVNLGGVLLTMGKLDEALDFNLYAVLNRPNDALANAQLGMTYFAVNNLDLAIKYLEVARRLDPAHFSHPQMTLAEIYLRRGQPKAAAEQMKDFLRWHPDWPQKDALRQAIEKLAGNSN